MFLYFYHSGNSKNKVAMILYRVFLHTKMYLAFLHLSRELSRILTWWTFLSTETTNGAYFNTFRGDTCEMSKGPLK